MFVIYGDAVQDSKDCIALAVKKTLQQQCECTYSDELAEHLR